MAKEWTTMEITFLQENYPDNDNLWLSKELNTSEASVMHKAYRMNLRKAGYVKAKGWTDNDISYLEENYSDTSNKELGVFFDKSIKAVLNKANRLGLSKSSEYSTMYRIENSNSSKNINSVKITVEKEHKCTLCEKSYDSIGGLGIHLTKIHKCDLKEYYLKNIGNVTECKYCEKESRFLNLTNGFGDLCNSESCISKSRAYNTKEWHDVNDSNYFEYTKKRLHTLGENDKNRLIDNPNYYKEKSHNCKEYWIKRDYTEEESVYNSADVVGYMQSVSHKVRKENPEKYAHVYNTKIEFYLKKGLSEPEAKIALSNRQLTFSKEICIEKYGTEKGIIVWTNRQEKWLSNMPRMNYSMVSQELFIDIWNKIKKYNYETYFATLDVDYI